MTNQINTQNIRAKIWLVIFFIISLNIILDAGFDNDVSIYTAIILSVILILDISFDDRAVKINKIALVFFVFLLWSSFSITWSVYPIRTVIELVQLSVCLSTYVLITKLSEESLDKIVNSVLIIAFLVSTLGLGEYIFITGSRIQSTFTNPNPFGIFIGMIFLTTLSISIRIKSKLFNFLSVFFLTILFLSGSRASMGAVLFSMFLVYFGLSKEEIKKGIIKTSIIILIALITSQILMYVSIYIRENIFINKSILESITRKSSFVTSSLKGRLEFWRVAFELFKNKPITGYGLGTYFCAYYTEYGMNQWYTRFTHNHYLQIASELGIVGIMLFLSFIWNSFKGIVYSAKKDYKPEYFWGIVSAIVAFLLHIGVDFTWNFPGVTIIFILFLAIITKDIPRTISLSKPVSYIFLILLIVVSSWQLASTKLYQYALNNEDVKSNDSTLKIVSLTNKGYPISTFGLSYESDLYLRKHQVTNNINDLENSLLLMEKAVKLAPYDYNLANKLASIYYIKGDNDKAIYYLEKAVKNGAYILKNYIDLGNIYYKSNKIDMAKETFLSGLDLSEYALKASSGEDKDIAVMNIATMHFSLAHIYSEKNDNNNAKENLQKVEELKLEYPFLKELLQ